MHVPWGWAKQRPHFLAEHLSDKFNIQVFYKKSYRQSNMNNNAVVGALDIEELFVLPKGNSFRMIGLLNRLLIKFQLRKRLKQYDIIWVGHPEMYTPIADSIPDSCTVVYDCMDDALEFPGVKENKSLMLQMKQAEGKLVGRSNYIICSAENLALKMQTRYGLSTTPRVVNNAINIREAQSSSISTQPKILSSGKKTKTITYVGTISEWFDFELLLKSLEVYPNIEYVLVGPKEVPVPQHDRIRYTGPVPHDQVFSVLQQADVLIMPFKLNELILSVNPVKLYEYIFMSKPVLAVRYPETEKFSEFIHLYNGDQEYISQLGNILESGCSAKRTEQENVAFAQNNTWKKRAEELNNIIGVN